MGNFWTVQIMNAENMVKRVQELWESRSVFILCTLILPSIKALCFSLSNRIFSVGFFRF